MKWNDNDDGEFWIVRAIVLLVAGLFTYYGFFNQQPCDIDAIYLSCRLTGTVGDWIGTIMFYMGCAVMMGIPKLFGVELFNPTGSSFWNVATFVFLVLSIVLIWNL